MYHIATFWKWDRVHESADMAVLEARVLRLALHHFAAAGLSRSVIFCLGDNQGVHDILSGGTVRRSRALQREFVGKCRSAGSQRHQ
eukprot:SAG31_NODE_589_length_13808_cov_3.896710_8_plen_86_part_00